MTGKGTYQLSPNKLVGYYSMNTEFFNPFPTSANQFHPFQNTTAFHWNPHQMKAELQGTPTPRLVFDILIGRQAAGRPISSTTRLTLLQHRRCTILRPACIRGLLFLYPSAPEHRTFGNDYIFPPGSFL
jgi:hypothetical protein